MTTRASTTKGNPAPAATTIDPILARALGPDAAQLPPELATRVADALRASATPAATAPLQRNPHCQFAWPALRSNVIAHRRAADLQQASLAAWTLAHLLRRDIELQDRLAQGDDVTPFCPQVHDGLQQALAIALDQIERHAEAIYGQAAMEAGE